MTSSAPLARMAWRNIWRQRRRTLISLAGIAFGVLFAVILTGLGDATYGDMIDYAARMGTGHVTVEHESQRTEPSTRHPVAVPHNLEQVLHEDPRVERLSLRVQTAAFLATARGSVGTALLAFDPDDEDADSFPLLDALSEGEGLRDGSDTGIVLGSRLARRLDTRVGKRVVYTVTDRHGEMVSGLAKVRGILETGAASVDNKIVLMALAPLQARLGYGTHEVTSAAIFLEDHRDAASVASWAGDVVPSPAVAIDWRAAQPELASFIDLKVNGASMVEGLVMLLLAAGVFNTIFVSVMERRREFGVLRALGFSPSEIFTLVTWESLWVAVFGLLAAAAVTTPPYLWLHEHGVDVSGQVGATPEISGVIMSTIMPVEIFPENLLIIAALVPFATLLAGLYPAWIASRVEPVDAIASR